MSAPHPAVNGTGHETWASTLRLAAEEVFELMLNSKLSDPGPASQEQTLDVTAMVGLAGKLCGVMTVRCPRKAAARMAGRMLGIDADHAGQETWDAVGEICNMVAGNFKNKIAGLGDGCMLSVPSVITGGDYSLRSLVNDEIRTIHLFEGEPMVVTLEVHS